MKRSIERTLLGLMACMPLGGCAVVSVAGAVAGAAISVTGAVVSTGITVTGKVIGAGIDAVAPDKKPDNSSLVIKHTESPAAGPPASQASAAPTPAASASPVAPNGELSPRPLQPAASAAG